MSKMSNVTHLLAPLQFKGTLGFLLVKLQVRVIVPIDHSTRTEALRLVEIKGYTSRIWASGATDCIRSIRSRGIELFPLKSFFAFPFRTGSPEFARIDVPMDRWVDAER